MVVGLLLKPNLTGSATSAVKDFISVHLDCCLDSVQCQHCHLK
jgi:hypothetical protein